VIGFAARAPLEESVVTVAKSDGAAKSTSFPPYYPAALPRASSRKKCSESSLLAMPAR
jgi:hypothetical protein